VRKEPIITSLIMIVDPNKDRRRQLIAGFTREQIIDAVSLHDAYSLVEEVRPRTIILSDTAAQEAGLTMFLQLATLVGAMCIAFGNTLPPDLPAQIPWVPYREGGDPRKILDVRSQRGRAESTAKLQQRRPDLVVIGASTGGVAALETVLSRFTAECPPTLIVQHIRPGFVDSMVQRLERSCAPRVIRASHGAHLDRGTVYVAADDKSHLTIADPRKPRCAVIPGPETDIHRPSVNALFHSAVAFGSRVSAALLTGMGSDGAAGLAAIRAAGGMTVAQDEATSTVYGMPRVAAEIGAATVILPLQRIADALLSGLPMPLGGSA
jgi:two-component system, chemotaxis family, protein-glutamate methylesterase/glutaminase